MTQRAGEKERHDRIPPQDLEAEVAVLGAILQDSEALLKVLDALRPDHFYRDAHRRIFAAALALFARNEPVDLITITDELRRRNDLAGVGGPAALVTFIEQVPTAANVVHHARIVREKAKLRTLAELGERVMDLAFTNGHGVEAILADVEAAFLAVQEPAPGEAVAPLSVGAEEFLAGKIEPVRWAIRKIWPAEASGTIAGPEKVGKTWIAEEMAIALSTGTPLFGKYEVPRPLRVLRWEEEDGEGRTKRRVHQLLTGRHRPWPSSDLLHYLVAHGLRVDDPDGLRRLEAELESFRPELVILGNLREVHSGDENRPADMARVRDALSGLTRRYGCSFILIHHFRKEQAHQSRRGTQMMAGSNVIGAWVQAWLWITPGDSEDIALIEVGSKDAAGAGRLVVQRRDLMDREPLAEDEDGQKVWPVILAEVQARSKVEATRERILEILERTPGATTAEVAAELKVTERTAASHLRALEGADLVVGTQESSRQAKRWRRKSPEEAA